MRGPAVATETFPKFIDGSTTVAEVEQDLGAPFDTSMQPDGALTLVYPATRVPHVSGRAADGPTIYLHFGADFRLRHISRANSANTQGGRRLASR
jgi:hypothetical protein